MGWATRDWGWGGGARGMGEWGRQNGKEAVMQGWSGGGRWHKSHHRKGFEEEEAEKIGGRESNAEQKGFGVM